MLIKRNINMVNQNYSNIPKQFPCAKQRKIMLTNCTYDSELLRWMEQEILYHTPYKNRNRMTMIDWMFRLFDEHTFNGEKCNAHTLFRCINYFDRYMCNHPSLPPNYVERVCCACFNIATAIEEIAEIDLTTLHHNVGKRHSVAELKEAQTEVLSDLDYNLYTPTPADFADVFLEHFPSLRNEVYRCLCVAMMFEETLLFSYSQLAVAALYLAIQNQQYNHLYNIETMTRYKQTEIQPCVQWLESIQIDNISQDILHIIKDHF